MSLAKHSFDPTARLFDLVLFDLDGTLIDSAAQLARAVNLTLTELGLLPADEAVIRTWVGNGADTLMQRALDYRMAPPALLVKARPLFFKYYHDCLLQGLAMYEGVANSLRRLQTLGYQQAIVTNKPSDFVAPILKALGISDCFALWLGGNCVAVKKPSPEPLLHACQRLNVSPARTLMVGDSKNDVLAAQAAGIKVVGLTYGYNYGQSIADSHPDWVFEQFSQLDALLL
ncbi:MAG: phosphoglycolate phosphatase [Aeromonas sp.]